VRLRARRDAGEGRERAARGEKKGERWAAGWANEPNTSEEIRKCFLFLFPNFKAFSIKILNPLLNLKPTTQYKNSNATT
jgi:hypothetical protein